MLRSRRVGATVPIERMHQQGVNNLERRGGMCWMHQEDSANSDSEEEESGDDGELRLCSFRGCISEAANGVMCVRHSTTCDDDCLEKDI